MNVCGKGLDNFIRSVMENAKQLMILAMDNVIETIPKYVETSVFLSMTL
jgi:hypothetical protein